MSYKIILDSYDGGSYSGNQYNAVYPINMNEVIRNPNDLNSAYMMSIKIISASSYSSDSGFSPSIIYGYNVNLVSNGRAINAYQYNSKHFNCCGFLSFQNNIYTYSSVTAGSNTVYSSPLNINVDDKDFYVENLHNVSAIRFQVFSAFDNTLFVSSDDTKSRYNVILTFVKI
jgi:hypothetical protein